MTIVKSYSLQIDYEDGDIDHVTRKGKTAEDALERTRAEFPEAYYVSVTGRKLEAKWKRYWARHEKPGVFARDFYKGRMGKYLYRHKGRKIRGRKNYQGIKYVPPLTPVTFTFTEHYAEPVSAYLTKWVSLLTPDTAPFVIGQL